jgi:hypothetical protein
VVVIVALSHSVDHSIPNDLRVRRASIEEVLADIDCCCCNMADGSDALHNVELPIRSHKTVVDLDCDGVWRSYSYKRQTE